MIEVPQNSLATTGDARIVEIGLEVGDVVAVHVAAEHDHAGHLLLRDHAEQPVAGLRVAVPGIGPVAAATLGRRILPRIARHQRLLGQQIPWPRQIPALGEPALLREAEQAALRIHERRAVGQRHRVPSRRGRASGRPGRRGTGGRRPVGCGRACPSRADRRMRMSGPTGPCRFRKRHVLPVGTISGGATGREIGLEVLGLHVGVVVGDLVVVPHQQPRRRGVRGLQQRVALVRRVAGPVLVERPDLAALDMANRPVLRGVLVDVVTEEEDDVRALRDDMAPRGIEADVPALAAADDEAERGRARRRRARCACGRSRSAGRGR